MRNCERHRLSNKGNSLLYVAFIQDCCEALGSMCPPWILCQHCRWRTFISG